LSQKGPFFTPLFGQNYFKNHKIGPGCFNGQKEVCRRFVKTKQNCELSKLGEHFFVNVVERKMSAKFPEQIFAAKKLIQKVLFCFV
jgi:hypothetical protein